MTLEINSREVFEVKIPNQYYYNYDFRDKAIYEDNEYRIRLTRCDGHLFLTIIEIPPFPNSTGLVLFEDYFKPYMFRKDECHVLYISKYMLGHKLIKTIEKLKIIEELKK